METGGNAKIKVSQLIPSVRVEVEKPFQDKLEKAKTLVKLWTKLHCCVSCSFGKDSMVVLWLVREIKPDVPVLFNNTGIEYPETIAFKEKVVKEFGINLIETKPEVSYWEILERIQKKGFRIDDGRKHSNICCYHLKHKPSKKAIQENGFQVNFDGLTALESRHRMFIACHKGMEYYTKKLGLQTVHPILFWTPKEVFEYCSGVQIPCNPVYEKYGLDRVGCVPCTSHREWRAQLAKTNPKMYQFISEKYFGQKLLEVSEKLE